MMKISGVDTHIRKIHNIGVNNQLVVYIHINGGCIKHGNIIEKHSINKLKVKTKWQVCPYCGVHGTTGPMYRWHFDNCNFIKNKNHG